MGAIRERFRTNPNLLPPPTPCPAGHAFVFSASRQPHISPELPSRESTPADDTP